MVIPDFSVPSEDCFLTVDKFGQKIKAGDTLVSYTNSFRGGDMIRATYKVEKYQRKLVAPVKPSFLLNYFVKSYCEVMPKSEEHER